MKRYNQSIQELLTICEEKEYDIPKSFITTKALINKEIPKLGAIPIYGDKNLPDKDAYVITFFGEGFTIDEQVKFYLKVCEFSNRLVETSPWNEFKNEIKIYAIGSISRDSGCKGDKVNSYKHYLEDNRVTYFGVHFWDSRVMDYLGFGNSILKINRLAYKYKPESDTMFVLVNSARYAGVSNKNIAMVTLSNNTFGTILHELGHCVGNLEDEYYNIGQKQYYCLGAPNLTTINNPYSVKWKRFIGKNNIGLFRYTRDSHGVLWYKPSNKCRMNNPEDDYCEVCKEALRKEICNKLNAPKLFLQTYCDNINIYDGNLNIKDYFILRKGNNELTGAMIRNDINIKYYDLYGKMLNIPPKCPGKYIAVASYNNENTKDSCIVANAIDVCHSYQLFNIKLNKNDDQINNYVYMCQYCGKTIELSSCCKDFYDYVSIYRYMKNYKKYPLAYY